MPISTLDHSALEGMVRSGAVKQVTVEGASSGWQIVAHVRGKAGATLEAKRGHLRSFRTLETATSYLANMGVSRFEVDARGITKGARGAQRPDTAALMQAKQTALDHQRWFSAEVEKGRASLAAGKVSSLDSVINRLHQQAKRMSAKGRD